ncbi:MAG: polymer-forming cytoskeletal protein [Myxococcales bacterium]|nr:polymer-forming cytoskeletal protein [Myxococcales bacterium]MDD9970586.1 polymer-forming cytoskeletal protein [Myxococcales bacterium]
MATTEQTDLTGIGELQALLGHGAEFEGKLAFEGRVRIDGAFKGEIRTPDVLILGTGAQVRADLHVGTLILRGGELWGDVTATRLVELYAPAKVHGNIRAPQLYMDKGVVFEGQCLMLEEDDESPDVVVLEDDSDTES